MTEHIIQRIVDQCGTCDEYTITIPQAIGLLNHLKGPGPFEKFRVFLNNGQSSGIVFPLPDQRCKKANHPDVPRASQIQLANGICGSIKAEPGRSEQMLTDGVECAESHGC